jgi:hypothetical protein
VALVLDHSRQYWGTYHADSIEFVRTVASVGGETSITLHCPNGYSLRLPLCFGAASAALEDSKHDPFILTRLSDAHRTEETKTHYVSETVPLFETVRSVVASALERGVVHGDPSLIFPGLREGASLVYRELAMKILSVLHNSPYDARCSSGDSDKGDFVSSMP